LATGFFIAWPQKEGKMVSKIEEISKDQNGSENHTLPLCIGFGVLDDSRTRIEYPEDKNGEPILNASYVSYEGELVYKVRLGEESCRVEELFEGRMVGLTISPTLQKAFFQRFLCIGSNPRFRQMMGRITKDRNIEFVRPNRDRFRTVFFPAGLILVLRLPVVPDDRMTEIEPNLREISTHVSIDGVYGGESSPLDKDF